MDKKTIVIILLVVVAAGLAGGGYVLAHNHKQNTSSTTVVEQKKNAPVQTPAQAAQNDKPSQDIPVSTALSVTNVQAAEKGSVVNASATINGAKDASGSCVFTFSNDLAKPVVRQVTPTGTTPNITCSTGDISNVEFSVLGTWKLTVNYYENNTQAVGAGTVDIAN